MAPRTYTEEELANLSDDELMNMAIPPELTQLPEEEANDPAPTPDTETDVGDTPPDPAADDENSEDGAEGGDESAVDTNDGVPGDGVDELGNDGDPADADEEKSGSPAGTQNPHDGNQAKSKVPASDAEKSAKADTPDEPATVEPDYKAEYAKIMAPFKANGREIKLESIDEAIQLMQMGANYTKKMQALQPHLRMVKMLQNNGLLDENKLSFLIDLDKKSPQAIQKLLRDSGVDPMEIDTSVEPEYTPGNHSVSDNEMRFTTALDDTMSAPGGRELILEINKSWDQASQNELMKDPNILSILRTQKENGIYDQIVSEVERRKVLGTLGDVPFLVAYRDIGRELQGQHKLVPTSAAPSPSAPAQPPRVLDTRPAATKPKVTNSEKARAASPAKSTPPKKAAAADFNPLALSDEEFEKQAAMAQRL